jgi:hypothetical protein
MARAEEAVRLLGSTLRARLAAASAEGGLTRAVEVCAGEAGAITTHVREETGVRVDRASLRERGAHEDADVGHGVARRARGAPGRGRGGPVADRGRSCPRAPPDRGRGAVLGLPRRLGRPELEAILDARYPHDRARGYRLGDLRGAIWAEADVAR